MARWRQWLFGRVHFQQQEEYLEFQFHLLIVLTFTGALFTGFFLLGHYAGWNPLTHQHVSAMWLFTGFATLMWLILRGHKTRLYPVAWVYETGCIGEYLAALAFVPQDELRILWLFTNIPGVYILLGQRAGGVITGLTMAGFFLGNGWLSRPYSPNAVVTGTLAMGYLGVFFHFYGSRSISYFSRMQKSNQALRHMATHDPLTNTYNARAYYDLCNRFIQSAKRTRSPYAVLFVDLDHFKRVNDTYGHSVGDEVLKAVAGALSNQIRESDLLGRIGGEEFSIFLPATALEGATHLAEQIRRSISQVAIPISDGLLHITASIGVADNRNSHLGIEQIQQQADAAMYRAKAAGRNRVSTLPLSPP